MAFKDACDNEKSSMTLVVGAKKFSKPSSVFAAVTGVLSGVQSPSKTGKDGGNVLELGIDVGVSLEPSLETTSEEVSSEVSGTEDDEIDNKKPSQLARMILVKTER